ncbi:MAG: TerB family tellurite resistance protein [Helicobacter sp.]|nr:TerB family tellurite resistance protein [Helicobacteraceae bacterium]MDY3113257.1 TerB family tellurite resistance protein [Helicobacter sp.]
MEILLLITIVVVAIAFMNFKDYLHNPNKRPTINTQETNNDINYEDPYKNQPKAQDISKEEKIRKSEFGLIVALLSKLAKSDGKVCELELELMENTILDITDAIMQQSAMHQRAEILDILHRIFEFTTESVEELAKEYANCTKGQYKSRLKLVEYLLSLAYADGELDSAEREIILDVAAYLGIDNDDFNAIYDSFEEFYSKDSKNLELQEAYAVLGVDENSSLDEIKKKYKELVRENHPDILHHKGLDKSIVAMHTQKLQEINNAYEVINSHKKEIKA